MGMKIVVSDRCTGHGQCFTYCPEVFVPDEEGYSTVPDPSASNGIEDKVRAAAAACPERAIDLSE
ncbi:MAG: ferredoxin [Acidimicrobiia bacterium]